MAPSRIYYGYLNQWSKSSKSYDGKQERKDRLRFTRCDGEWMAPPAIWKPGSATSRQLCPTDHRSR